MSTVSPAPASPELPPAEGSAGATEPDVATSGELFAPVASGVELCYQTFGDPADEPMLLVMGLATQMTFWDPELCAMLARRGHYVIRFDNRDVGRSSRGRGRVTRGMLVRAFAGRRVRPPYSLHDLGADAFGLLDHLGIASAHLVGVSMGGMIVQTMALDQPQRVRSLTSIMSTTGKRSVGWLHPRLLPAMLRPIKPGREAYAESSVAMWRMIGSPGFDHDDNRIREAAREAYDRGVSSAGALRQMLAILTQPNRSPALRGVRVPTLVVHGLADRMVHVSGGRATAAAVPGAELLLIDGMGHDLPADLYPTLVDAISRVVARA
ncbi:alpha/beta fold hydrolase [Nocardioides cynanchi]|uniref:alpha/beta fold hydrolase n=1 Tax=Nocardioides cynanchi TaxID=2558918 RepID=UPI001EE26D0B|nr:alpha/beta fold hydrolase [Nocardioides cynanchi]